jgi:Holliday junction resolvasome RuvABC endonuclease subunit
VESHPVGAGRARRGLSGRAPLAFAGGASAGKVEDTIIASRGTTMIIVGEAPGAVERVLGIDPGAVSGGCAIVEIGNGVTPQLVDAIDLPIIGVKAKQRIDVLALRTWIQQHRPDRAVIERGQAMPRQGGSSGFKFGRGCGALEATIQLLEVPMTIVEPTAWKKFHQLRGGDKEASRQRALQLFPAAHSLLARRKDHGRAEATLIALYGAKS